MKKLNVYIVKQIIIGFLLVSFSLMSILWLTQSLRFVSLITNKGIPIGLFVEMTSLLMPRLFVILSPICLFVSVLKVFILCSTKWGLSCFYFSYGCIALFVKMHVLSRLFLKEGALRIFWKRILPKNRVRTKRLAKSKKK